MINEPLLTFLLAGLMGLVHFLGEELETYLEGYKEQVVSFSSGVSITYIFVQLLPEFHRVALNSTDLIFIFPLIGFSSIHLLEKYLAKSSIEGERLKNDYGELHSAFIFLYSGAIGYLIAAITAENTMSGVLFFIPILMHVAVSSLSLTELHESFLKRKSVKITVSFAPILGVLFHYFELISRNQFNPIFGTVIGMFFYVVIRDSIPAEDKGLPREYILGSILYLSFIIFSRTLST